MKCACGDYGDGKTIYRDSVLVDKKYFSIKTNPDDMVLDVNDPPEGYIICDTKIAPIVCRLNIKGYETVYSCQGHMDYIEKMETDCINHIYILFKAGKNFNRYADYLLKLPKQFDVEISCDINDIEQTMKEVYEDQNIGNPEERLVVIRSNLFYKESKEAGELLTEETFNKYNDRDIIDLMNWVESLPDLNIEFSKCLYDERIIDRATANQLGFDFESAQEFTNEVHKAYYLTKQNIEALRDKIDMFRYHFDYIEKSYSRLNDKLAKLKFIESYKDIKDDDEVEVVEDIDRTSMYDPCINQDTLKLNPGYLRYHNEDDFIKDLDIYKELMKIKKEKSEEK